MRRQVTMEDLMPIFREQLENGKKVQFAPSGISMRPMLDNKVDQVYIERATKDNIKKWDVVLYQNHFGAYIMHRVIKLDDEGFVTRGDNNYYNDKKQSYDTLIGRVYEFEHKGKKKSINAISYKVYAIVWIGSYFPRKFLRKIKGKISRMSRK